MQFTKVFSILALATSAVHALPEPIPAGVGTTQGPVSANSTVLLVSNAFATLVTGAEDTNDANTKVVAALMANYIASAQQNADVTAAGIAVIVGQTSAYAKSIQTLLTTLTVCIAGSASGGASASS